MAHSRVTPLEFIQNAFAPQVALICSEDADNLCLKNNLRFVELLQPFSRIPEEKICAGKRFKPGTLRQRAPLLTTVKSMPLVHYATQRTSLPQCAWLESLPCTDFSKKVQISDPSGNMATLKNFKINFEDMNRHPPQPTDGKKILSEAVSSTPWDQETSKSLTSWTGGMNISVNLQSTTVWFEEWRDIFLQIQYPSDHEFTKHYIACIFVISAGSDNPIDQLNKLSQYQHQQQHQNQTRFLKWFSPNIMKYYLLVQDVDEVDTAIAERVFEDMISAYGSSNCHLLKINSRGIHQSEADAPDPWRQVLQQRRLVEGNAVAFSGGSEASSGSGTPREDLVVLPLKVIEGNLSDSSETPAHPLSPVAPYPDDKNELIDNLSVDVPLVLSRHALPSSSLHPTETKHGGCLTPSDLDRITSFVCEFCISALIPHVERQIRHLNDVVTNRSRSKSLLSATRRWLGGGSKPATGGATSVVYSQEATELQTRRLGDLCFMFGLFEAAYNAYFMAKNDFKSDQAWVYFAGAQEMAAIAAFMLNQGEYPKRYLDGSLHTYLNVCKVYNFAIRLTLLSTEVLKYGGEFGEAAMMFIKMTSEESDLLSALMLEQAAHCFLNSRRPLVRKYAFHMTLAGHRFSKAGQRAHSLRTYKQAFQVYFNHGWILAEDHIHYTMGKQAFQLHYNHESLEATTRLVYQGVQTEAPTQQTAVQQFAYMREFLNILNKCLQDESHLSKNFITLPVPILMSQSTKIIIGDPVDSLEVKREDWQSASHICFADEDSREKQWFALENQILRVVQGPSMIFRPNLQRLTDTTPNTNPPCVPVKERVAIQVRLRNPLLIGLTLSFIRPLYAFYNEAGEEVPIDSDTGDASCVHFETVSSFIMTPSSEELITLFLWPQRPGKVLITGVAYHIAIASEVSSVTSEQRSHHVTASVQVQQPIEVQGPRLNGSLQERVSIMYAKDERLNIRVGAPMPRLQVAFRDLPAIMSCGEVHLVEVLFRNAGTRPLSTLHLAVSQPKNVFFSLVSQEFPECISNERFLQHVKGSKDYHCVERVQEISLPNGTLAVGDSIRGHLWLHAPQSSVGTFDVELLFYYEAQVPSQKNSFRYRLLRHLSSIYIYPSLNLKVKSCPSVGLISQIQESVTGLSRSHWHHVNLDFHINNKCEVENGSENIYLLGVAANSGSYELIPHSLEGTTSIGMNENGKFVIQAVHIQQRKENELISSFVSAQTSPYSLPSSCFEFALRERLKLPYLTSELPSPSPINTYVPPPPTENEIKAKQLKESLELDMVASVIWKGKRGTEEIICLHSVYLDRLKEELKSEESMPIGTEEESPPVRIIPENDIDATTNYNLSPTSDLNHLIKVVINLPSKILHNFKKEALCMINYSATFYNSSSLTHYTEVQFSSKPLVRNSDGGESENFTREANPNLLAVGASTRKFRLEPFRTKILQARSVVTSPGTYYLGAFLLRIRQENVSDWIPQASNYVQSSILVQMEAPSVMERHMASELASIHSVSSAAVAAHS